MAKTENVEIQMAEILDEVQKGAKEALSKGIDNVSKESVQKLRNTSPRRTSGKNAGRYAKGWTVKKNRDGDVVVHNKTDYQLTHLLENGHVIRNKKGTYGRTHGIKHIAPAAEWASDELPRRVMEDLNL
jgi:hypothetical protein